MPEVWIVGGFLGRPRVVKCPRGGVRSTRTLMHVCPSIELGEDNDTSGPYNILPIRRPQPARPNLNIARCNHIEYVRREEPSMPTPRRLVDGHCIKHTRARVRSAK